MTVFPHAHPLGKGISGNSKKFSGLFRKSFGHPQATKIVFLGIELSLIPSNSLSATKLASAESRFANL
jgi:hypothetical protein